MKKLIALVVSLWTFILISCCHQANAGIFSPPQGIYTWQWQEYGPRVNELCFRILPNYTDRVNAFQAGEIQVLAWPRPEDVDIFSGDNQTITAAPEFHCAHMGFNMRKWPFMQDATGNAFRHATAHLVPKDEIISTLFMRDWGNIMERCDNFVVLGQRPWFNPSLDKHPYSIDEAVSILSEAGYSFVDNAPIQGLPSSTVSSGPEDYWLTPEGVPLPVINVFSPEYSLSPTAYSLLNMTVTRMHTAGLTSVVHLPMDFATYISLVKDEHDFDMYFVAYRYPRVPTQLYILFHSSRDFPGGDNLNGIHDSTLDAQLEAIRFPTSLTEAENAISNAETILSELLPCIPLYTRNVENVFSSDLDGIVNTYGYEIHNQWAFLNIHYQGRPLGGTLNWSIAAEPNAGNGIMLNPLLETSDRSMILDRISDGLLAENPETGELMPWIATNWEIQPWTAPGNIPGMNVTFWLRDDVYWHDNVPFDAEDVKFALEYISTHQLFTRSSTGLWRNLVEVIASPSKPHVAEIHFNATNYWVLYDISRAATSLPKHIWEGVTDPFGFQPWNEPHPTVPGLTKLVGTGPFCFVNYVPNEYVLLRASSNYFRRFPTSTSKIIGSIGGNVSNVARTASLEIPSGTFTDETTVSIEEYPTSEYGGFLINQSENIVSYGVHKFGPSSTTFSTNITITLTYDESQVDESHLEQLAVFSSDDGINWYQVPIESIDTVQNIVTLKVSHFSLFAVLQTPILRGSLSGTILDEYTCAPIQEITVSLLEKGISTTTDDQGRYSFSDIEAGSYTVEMTVPYGYLTHYAVTKFVEVHGGQDSVADFTAYPATWSGATIPRTIGYWKNWNNHYTAEVMQTLIGNVKSSSGLFDDLTLQNINRYFEITSKSSMKEKGQAQLLASWLNVVSAQLGVDVQVDVRFIEGWETIITDEDGSLTVNELLRQIDNYYVADAGLTKAQWEAIKNILDALNNGRLFI